MPPTAETLSGITGSDRGRKSTSRKMMKKNKMKKGASAPKSREQRDEKETREAPSNAASTTTGSVQPSATFNPFQSYLSQIEHSFGVTSIENNSFVAPEVQEEGDREKHNMEQVHASYGNANAPQLLPTATNPTRSPVTSEMSLSVSEVSEIQSKRSTLERHVG